MAEKLKVGVINYANVFPLYYSLLKTSNCSEYEFIEAYPSELNKMLREGFLDVSISSSIEYLRHRNDYEFIDGHSISSDGPVESIMLFSREPIDKLNLKTICVTNQSETSPVLLEIILKKFKDINAFIKTTNLSFMQAVSECPAYLSIGDEALIEAHCARKIMAGEDEAEIAQIGGGMFYIYDLGKLWHLHTGLPFVFALWIMNKKAKRNKGNLIKMLGSDLALARDFAMRNLEAMANASPIKDIIGVSALASYWQSLSYSLGGRHLQGLELFANYATELNLL